MTSDAHARRDSTSTEEGLRGFVSAIRSSTLLAAEVDDPSRERVSVEQVESGVLADDLAILLEARSTGRTIDQIMRQSPVAVRVMARYGVYTTMNVARDPGGMWAHYQRQSANRVLGRWASRLRKSLSAVPEFAPAGLPVDKKTSKAERRQRQKAGERKMAILAVQAYCSTLAMEVHDPNVTEAKVAKRGPRKGQVVEGTIGVAKQVYVVPQEGARLLAGTLQATMRAAQLDRLHPVYMDTTDDDALRVVELSRPTEFTNRAAGAVTYRMVEDVLVDYGFVPPHDKRSPQNSGETFHPLVAQLRSDLGTAYQQLPVAIYERGRFVRLVLKDPGLLIQEASHTFQAFRDAIREMIESVRGDSNHNKEHHKFIRLLFEGKDVLKRRRVRLGQAQMGPASARGRDPSEVVTDYVDQLGQRIKVDPVETLLELGASVPASIQEVVLSGLKLVLRIAGSVGWFGRDAVAWAKKKLAARKDTTVDDLINNMQAELAQR